MTQVKPLWPGGDGEMAARVRAFGWAATPLGPVGAWSDRLTLMVEQVLASPLVASLVCGPERVLIYNDAAARLYGHRHPAALGRPLPETFPEGWGTVAPYYERAFAGETVQVAGQPVDTRGEGSAADVFDALLTPVREADGRVAHVHMTGSEVGDRARNEAALRESGARLAQLADAVPVLIWETGEEGATFVNSHYLAYFGVSDEEIDGLNWARFVHPDDVDGYIAVHEQAFAERRPYDYECRLLRADGRYRWYRTNGRPASYGRFIGSCTDIHDLVVAERALREREERQAFLLKLSDALTSLDNPDDVADAACRLLVEGLAASRAQYTVMTVDTPGAELADVRGGSLRSGEGLVRRFPMNAFGSALVDHLRSGQMSVVGDITAETRITKEQRDVHLNAGSAAHITAPRVRNGRLVATLTVHDLQARQWTPYEISLVGEVADRTWAAVERARAEAALRASEERYRELFERINEGFCIIDMIFEGDKPVDYRFVDVNPAFEHHTGIVGAKGRLMREIAPEHEQHWFDAYGAVAVTGEARRFQARAKALGDRWYDVNAFRVGEPEQRRVAIVFSDITQLQRDAATLRESEERLRTMTDHVPVLIWETDARGAVSVNGHYLDFFGVGAGEIREMGWARYLHPDDAEGYVAAYREAFDRRRPYAYECRFRRADGQYRWLRNSGTPLGETRFIGCSLDVTDLLDAQSGLRESEERFAQFAASSSDALWIRDAATLAMEYTSPAIQAIYGIAPDGILGDMQRWVGLIVPEDRETAIGHIAQARAGIAVTHEFRVRRPSDGEERWIRNTDFPLHDAEGRVQRIGGIAEDVTEARGLRERQEVLVAELQHRTRNLMGVVRSMADKTMRRSADLADFQTRYGDRLAALARVQGLLSRLAEGQRIAFDELVHAEIAALDGAAERATVTGPKGVALRSSTVQTFALALHELATNAVKYGAFAQPQGRLEIRWHVERAGTDGRAWLHVDWRERDVRMPAAGAGPQGGGSGRELIERALPYQLGARTTYVMAADGVHCTIALPVSDRQAAREPTDA